MAKDAPGMKGVRSRNKDGTLRRKRSDTHASTVEKNNDVDLETRGDTHLGTLLERDRVGSQDRLVRKHKK